jgi:hypothetical protein
VGAAIVASAAMVAVFAFILTKGSPTSTDDGLRMGAVPDDASASAPAASGVEPSPSVNSSKADRKPPAGGASVPSASAKAAQTSAPVNTGPESPAFKRGQWIAVLDKYPTDVGLEADQLAKNTAAKLIAAGLPAKAMLVDGQYPGIANSSMEPVSDTWVVYLGPGTSSAQMEDLCSAPKTQRAYKSPACPTYEPAVAPG